MAFGFKIDLVLADSLYGESHPFVEFLDRSALPWIVAIRSNHGVWMPEESEITYSDWQGFERVFSEGRTEQRYIQETIFGRRLEWRYWLLTNDPVTLPKNSTWSVMSHLDEHRGHFDQIGNLYGLKTWVEYGFKPCKDKLGWADYRVTQYAQIERWWEIVSSAYLMVSLQFEGLDSDNDAPSDSLLEKFQQLLDQWAHPEFASIEEFAELLEATGLTKGAVITADWAQETLPSWIDSIWQGIVRLQGLVRFGLSGSIKSLREVPTLGLMRLAFGAGLCRFGMFRAVRK